MADVATGRKARASANKTKQNSPGPATVTPTRAFRYCALPPQPKPVLPPEVMAHPTRLRAIMRAADKWANHTTLHYAFFRSGSWAVPDAQGAVIRKAFETWKEVPIGLSFVEIDDLAEAEVRIAYDETDGSWSYVGTGILSFRSAAERTMNFGWPLNQDPYGMTTAIHEIGHTLGMPHEHQNPHSGIVWDEKRVYESLGGPPNNWDRTTTFHNVLSKLDEWQYTGSQWDPDSVMEYSFGPGLIKEPATYNRKGLTPPGTISAVDEKWAKLWYPAGDFIDFAQAPEEPTLTLNESITVNLENGGQVDYKIEVDHNRTYTISSFGATDTKLTLFEDVDGEPRFLAGDDDSGADRTASITQRLRPGRTYHARLRVLYGGRSGPLTLMYW